MQPSRSLPSITLRPPPKKSEKSDDSGVLITTQTVPRPPNPGQYQHVPFHLRPAEALNYVPPIACYCIQNLVPFFDQLQEMGIRTRINYKLGEPQDVLRALINIVDPEDGSVDLRYVDPRLWAVIIQIYNDLPKSFYVYRTALSDKWLPSLQRLESMADFTFITILDLSSQNGLDDSNIIGLKPLHQLCVLDCSGNFKLSVEGIRKLSKVLLEKEEDEEEEDGVTSKTKVGPWKLRVLVLRNIRNINNNVTQWLKDFPLLCVVDLRGTSCTSPAIPSWSNPSSSQAPDASLFRPNTLFSIVRHLASKYPRSVFESSSVPFAVSIRDLAHPDPPRKDHNKISEERDFVLFSNRDQLRKGNVAEVELEEKNMARMEREARRPKPRNPWGEERNQRWGSAEPNPYSCGSDEDHSDIYDESDEQFSDEDMWEAGDENGQLALEQVLQMNFIAQAVHQNELRRNLVQSFYAYRPPPQPRAEPAEGPVVDPRQPADPPPPAKWWEKEHEYPHEPAQRVTIGDHIVSELMLTRTPPPFYDLDRYPLKRKADTVLQSDARADVKKPKSFNGAEVWKNVVSANTQIVPPVPTSSQSKSSTPFSSGRVTPFGIPSSSQLPARSGPASQMSKRSTPFGSRPETFSSSQTPASSLSSTFRPKSTASQASKPRVVPKEREIQTKLSFGRPSGAKK